MADWAGPLFRRIAVPRAPGSAAVSMVEDIVADQLDAFGYEVRRQRFETGPHRLQAGTVAAIGVGWWALGLFPLLILPLPAWAVTVTGVSALAVVALLASRVARRGVKSGAAGIEATNVFAWRSASPRLWLVAHLDSKAQKLSLRARVIATLAVGLGATGLLACLMLRLMAPLPVAVIVPWVLLSLAGGAALSGPPLRGESAGAVDNASGIIAVLVAAERLRHRTDVGVLVTGAEEFGMEGARAWTQTEHARGLFANVDGIDHVGRYNVMIHAPKHRGAGGIDAADIADAVGAEVSSAGHRVRRSRLPLGVFVDGSVLAAAGMSGVTLSRGDWGTLGVVHTADDVFDRTTSESAVEAGVLLARAAASALG